MKESRHNKICYFAQTNWRERRENFGIKLNDRFHHFYILGKTGTGKTTLLLSKIVQDLKNDIGFCLIDVHGDLIQQVLSKVRACHKDRVVFLDTADPKLELGYNPLKKVSFEKRPLIASSILEVFQQLWGLQAWGVRVEHILRNILLTLLDQDKANLSDILKILRDTEYRERCLAKIENPDVREFWDKEFKGYSKNDLAPIYNKVGGFLAYPVVKRILVSNPKQLSLREIMDSKRVLLINLSKGTIGKDASQILGSLFLTSLASSAFSRADRVESKRQPFFVYLDEFQNYTTLSLVEMLSELRKYKLGLILAHQYISQLDSRIRDAVLGNVGTIVSFRLSLSDARILEKEFYPTFKAIDFIDLPNYHIYLRLMINGKPSKAFSAITLPPKHT